ncbi:type VI secretion system tip protein VgrG [Abyssibius alkaniclasticus]|uniref:type VI secretion system Vgr family protein n=1 Tax=Abyssibius alkaniclasticus TaxID=2881234 RepID=UPI0023636ED9|nr:type VI secretion system tip protein TssI/VgrG [Abyssibius alkaniclasticus]UPH72390.1 type VI secretion system tip protein VgrG [Abyssibius alkaniclasticus]
MAGQDIVQKNRQVRIKGPLGPEKMVLLRAEVEEGLSQIGKADIQFLSPDHDLSLEDIVGKRLGLEIDDKDGNTRYWQGYCANAAYEGRYGGQALFRCEMRPTLYFLTLGRDCRIFQDKSALDVVKQVMRDADLTDFEDKTTATYNPRVYTVQYRESDFDFISRLMEEEGIYYYFKHDDSKETLVLADSSSAHVKLQHGADSLEFHFKEDEYKRDQDHIYEWKSAEAVNTGKVTMTDYDFENPTSDLAAVTAIAKGTHSFKDIEYYDYPGHHLTAEEGKVRTRVRTEAHAAQHNRSRGKGNVRWLAAGGTFTMKEHPRSSFNKEYLVLSARHKLSIETDTEDKGQAQTALQSEGGQGGAPVGDAKEGDKETTPAIESDFSVQLKAEPYRAPKRAPIPKISGLQTAVVTGPSGEEIYTDKHGRIKVQFHWDREGNKDEKTTCFVRVMQHMSGQGWGAFHIPRIGQEVVVQFEEGNPDRPIIIGMLYNEAKKHPFAFPANMTQSGIKTNSSKGGGGFHELVFEDKKDEEFVRLQSEKDYKETIKNNAEISIGFEKMDPGDLTEKIYNHKTTELEKGDHTFTVKEGSEARSIAASRTLTVGEDETTDIGANRTETVGANEEVTIGGDNTVTVSGNYTLDVTGDILIKSGSKITLEVGGTSVVIDSSSIAISTTNVSVDASSSFEVSAGGSASISAGGSAELTAGGSVTVEASGAAEVKSSAILALQGSIVKIN